MNLLEFPKPKLKSDPNKECVEFVDELQKKVVAGEIQQVLVVALTGDGCIVDGWSSYNSERPYAVVGALEAIKIRYMKYAIEE